jgi:O-antigen/teichoic acid export membrane protein
MSSDDATHTSSHFRSGSLGAAMRNLRWLLGSRGLAAVLSLVYLAIVTRTLGPAGFGEFALVTGIAQTVALIVGFQTWQIILRYGTGHLHDGRLDRLARLMKAALLLDIGGAVAGCAIAAVAVFAIGPSFGWSPAVQRDAFLFCCVVLLAIRSTPMGLLRLYDRFGAAAAGDAMLSIVRLVGSLLVLAFAPSVPAFMLAWAASEIGSSALYWILAWRTGRGLPWRGRVCLREVRADNPGILRFSAATNGSQTVTLATRQLPVLLVGYFATPAAAGNYRLAHQLGRALARVSQLFSRALLPELLRIHTKERSATEFQPLLRRIMLTTLIGGGALVLLMLAVGKSLLILIAGEAFAAAYPLLVLLSVAAIIELIGVGFEPALIATGKAGLSFWTQFAAGLVLIVLMILLIPRAGTTGAAIAVVIGSAVAVGLMALAVRRTLTAAKASE